MNMMLLPRFDNDMVVNVVGLKRPKGKVEVTVVVAMVLTRQSLLGNRVARL